MTTRSLKVTFISEVSKVSFDKQFRGYNVAQVDAKIKEYEAEISKLKEELSSCKEDQETLKHQFALLEKKVEVNEKTNEEIARLALKEASNLIDKAKRNANMILKESLDYIHSLTGEMNDFKKQTIKFRSAVENMSKDILKTIDDSEVYSMINDPSLNLEDVNNDEGDSL